MPGEVWTPAEQELADLLGPLRLPREYVPVEPTLKQDWFLRRNELEVFFGGAAGPGKSWGLLMAALQYVDVAGYHALLLRPAITEFEAQGGLIEVSHNWLGGTTAHWNGGLRQWSFPSGATVKFGYLANQGDLAHYPGGGVSFVGFDELTLFTERLYLGMFRLARQAIGMLKGVPVRIRSASNPGQRGHGWVKSRFVDKRSRVRSVVYVPATIHDNPHLDYDAYVGTLSHMHPVDRERLMNGDWDVAEEGGKFSRQDFTILDAAPPATKTLRYWDLAATEPSQDNPDPDYTVGLRYSQDKDGFFTVEHIAMARVKDHEVEALVRHTAEEDGKGVPVYIEQDPGQAGKAQFSNYARRVLQGFPVHKGHTRINGVNAAKEVRARPVAAAAGNGLVRIVRGPNLHEFLDQLALFPLVGIHDDCVDALSGAHNHITSRTGGPMRSSVPRGQIQVAGGQRSVPGVGVIDTVRR